jgi:hypothetical protein
MLITRPPKPLGLDGTERVDVAQKGNEWRAVVSRVKKQFSIIIPHNQLHTPASAHNRIMCYTGTELYFSYKPPSAVQRNIISVYQFYTCNVNPLKMKRRLLYLKTPSVPRCKHFSSRL